MNDGRKEISVIGNETYVYNLGNIFFVDKVLFTETSDVIEAMEDLEQNEEEVDDVFEEKSDEEEEEGEDFGDPGALPPVFFGDSSETREDEFEGELEEVPEEEFDEELREIVEEEEQQPEVEEDESAIIFKSVATPEESDENEEVEEEFEVVVVV